MADAPSLTPPSHGLSATLFPNKSVEKVYRPSGDTQAFTASDKMTGRDF